MWKDAIAGEDYTAHIIDCIKDCSVYEIPILVLHPINGMTPLPAEDIGIERFKRIAGEAEKYNINLAIENQGNPEYIDFVFKNVQSNKLYFCFDSGHENYYSPNLDLLDLYGDKLIALHLHDNDGTEDVHALPFTGSVNWKKVDEKLNSLKYAGAIALETLNKGFENIKEPVEFLKIALERAKQIG
ncbi:MAG: sugar phosphate isomerase/epimerase [Lachnospiraceae bacterium]|nr:sugar phosphate isomerase/epimerase [Lachnospiraceae bacterium]